jgi:hypothetical protein
MNMSATTRVNGDFTNFTESTLYSVVQLKAIKITVLDAAAAAVSLSNEDSDAVGEVDQAVALIVREIQPLMFNLQGAGMNEIHAVIDGHAIDATTLENRIRHLGTTVGAGPVDISGTTVVIGTSITVA